MFVHGDLEIHHPAQGVQVGAVYRQTQSLPQKVLGNVVGIVLERDDAVFAGLGGKADDLFDGLVGLLNALKENVTEPTDSVQDHGKRTGDQYRPKGAAEYNAGSRNLGDVPDLAAFEQQAA